jgi:RNA polymerase sigma-70 factor (ECF subfamily)
MSRVANELARGYQGAVRAKKGPSLEAALLACWEAACREYPEVRLPAEAFARHLARHAPDPAQLPKLRHGELLVAAGCLAGDAWALAQFERCLGESRSALERLGGGSALTDEVLDQVRHLALAGKGAEPLLATFAGRGPLAGWLQAASVRTALNVRRRSGREVPLDDAPLAERASAMDPELELLKKRDQGHFQRAFTEAFAALSPRERTLLRLRFLDGLTLEQLAAGQNVHRTTVIRWLDRAHQLLLDETRRLLREKLGAGNATLASLLRDFDSQMDLSLRRALKTQGP